jgi:catechol 2,3-dioxygenase-like lactoylglutathione lyase family enzyme
MATVSVRYIVDDVPKAMKFYTEHLGFEVDIHPAPGFARLRRGDLALLLNAPGAGGAGQTVGDRTPQPGGWNRIQIEVEDLASRVEALRRAGVTFRSEIVRGNGGNQILVNDPAGNPVELFEPHSEVATSSRAKP